jgi:glycolate oxidase iron-sulfur subunit
MQTDFKLSQLSDPAMTSSEGIIRKCVHCGFCTATCPTYVLLGDELDSPRGRIYLMKDMLEKESQPTPDVVKHIDRCLSCLSCMTTCPSGVNYMHLVDHARAYIEQNYNRPLAERFIRNMLAAILPYRGRFRAALKMAVLGRPFAGLFARSAALRPVAAMLALAPNRLLRAEKQMSPQIIGGARVAILQGCAEPVLRPEIRTATLRLLGRMGCDVVTVPGEGCCGALVHHLGKEEAALVAARANVDAWMQQIEGPGLEAIIITASGCGTTIKDYGFMLRNDPVYAGKAERVASIACDISEFLLRQGLPKCTAPNLTVAYHSACSLQHGQKVTTGPVDLLKAVGFTVLTPGESHLCCGSAGTYNILQSEIATRLRDRKVGHLERLEPDVIATGNIGCATQIASGTGIPVVHTVELLDWATGGPMPDKLRPFANSPSQ